MIYETYLRSLKGGQMIAWMAAAAAAVLKFCGDHQIPQQHSYIAAGAAALAAAILFFLNPKALEWASPDQPDLATSVQAVIDQMRTTGGAPRNFSPPLSAYAPSVRPVLPSSPPAAPPAVAGDDRDSAAPPAPDPLDAIAALLKAAGKL